MDDLAKYNEVLIDHIGREYPRKNLYIKEIIKLQKDSKAGDIKALERQKELVRSKKEHPYNVKLKDYYVAENIFLKGLRAKTKSYETTLAKGLSRQMVSALRLKFQSLEKIDFYKEYIDLCYEAELNYRENKLILAHLPEIIVCIEDLDAKLQLALKERNEISIKGDEHFKAEYKEFKAKAKKDYDEKVKDLKLKKKRRLISKKAVDNGIIELKSKLKNELMLKKYDSKVLSNKETINNLSHELRIRPKQMFRVLNADISDLRRRTPVEMTNASPWLAFVTIPIPGLGQILNRQFIKGALMFIVSLYAYFVALPYALGKGNYQGDGIRGLITLAQGGLRVHRSLIFMIEGIIAVFLVLIALGLMYASFRDVYKTEKSKLKGIREASWFETKEHATTEGFPYLISNPAYLIMIFIVLVPVMTTVLLSFAGMDPQNQSKFAWVGFQNYSLILRGHGLAGSIFWIILGWTVVWTLLASSVAIIIGFTLALLVNNERIKFKRFFRTIYLLPWAVPAFITIMFFSILLSRNGAITAQFNSLINTQLDIKNNVLLNRVALIALQGWLGSAYVFLLSTGVLQSIPQDLHEAADIDGATSWKKTRRIVIPLVLFQTAPLLISQYIFNFNNFSIIHLFNQGGPFNPVKYGNLAGSSDLLISYIYKLTIENQYQSVGAAIAIVVSLALMLIAFIGFKNSKGFKEGRL